MVTGSCFLDSGTVLRIPSGIVQSITRKGTQKAFLCCLLNSSYEIKLKFVHRDSTKLKQIITE